MVYMDGFNLYYGLKSKGLRRLYWLDLVALSERLLQDGQTSADVRYFTSRLSGRQADKKARQAAFLRALETLPDLTIHYGHLLRKTRACARCGARLPVYEEKMTDVNVAVQLLGDAQDDRFETAFIVSGDSDLAGLVEAVLARCLDKRMIAAFSPNQRSDKLRRIASGAFNIGRNVLKESQLPDTVERKGWPRSRGRRVGVEYRSSCSIGRTAHNHLGCAHLRERSCA